jgi:hypothetical protein
MCLNLSENHESIFEPWKCSINPQSSFSAYIVRISEFGGNSFDVRIVSSINMKMTTLTWRENNEEFQHVEQEEIMLATDYPRSC